MPPGSLSGPNESFLHFYDLTTGAWLPRARGRS